MEKAFAPDVLLLESEERAILDDFSVDVFLCVGKTSISCSGPQRMLGIYVGFDCLSIIKYIESLTGDVFTTQFANYYFN